MSIFKQVDFSKIYAGNLPSGQHYCNWFAQYENEDATESINNNAFGLYSADAFSQCQQQNAISGNLSRYDESQAQILDFKRIKRNSNFLVPVILGYSDDRIVNISISNSSESDNNKLYAIGIEEGNGKMLSSYNLNHEITQSFLLDSFIITKIEDSSISTFSIFNDTTSLITYFISNEDDSVKALSLLVQPQQDGTPIEKKYNWNDLKSSSYTFYKYNIPFNSMGSGELNSIRLEEFHPNTLQEFIDGVKTGTIYISKNDLGYTLLTDSIMHPNYILSKIKFNYFNPLRNSIVDSFTFQVVGNTNNCINPSKFLRKDNNDITLVLKYQLNTEGMRLNTILNDGMNGNFISVESNTSPYYYAGGILFGWTTDKSNCFNIAENKIILQQEEPVENTILFKARNNINDSLKNFYTQFYISENEDNSYFYFSNSRDKVDLSTIDGAFTSKEINLYPIYLDDPNYITPVVEITNNSDPERSPRVSLTEDGLEQLIQNIKNYPVVDIISSENNGVPNIKVKYGDTEKDDKSINIGSNITFDNQQSSDYIETDEEQIDDNFNYYYQNENEEYILIETQEALTQAISEEKTIYKKLKQQSDGTFRVNINANTYEVPVKGINETITTLEQTIATTLDEARSQLTPPIVLENQEVILYTNDTSDENYGVGIYEFPNNKIFLDNKNPIILVTPVIGDNYENSPIRDLYPDQLENDMIPPSSWDIWANYNIICKDNIHPGEDNSSYLYLYFNKDTQKITLDDLPEGKNSFEMKLKIDIAIFNNPFMLDDIN